MAGLGAPTKTSAKHKEKIKSRHVVSLQGRFKNMNQLQRRAFRKATDKLRRSSCLISTRSQRPIDPIMTFSTYGQLGTTKLFVHHP
jgi:hypothetical protein